MAGTACHRHHSHGDERNRLIGVLLLEQNDECAVQLGCHMNLETIAPLSDDPIIKLPAVAKT